MAEPALQVALHQQSPIVLDVDVACEAGQLLALVGPSGSGKSTILRAIAGLYWPQNGKVICHGETWLDTARKLSLPPHMRKAGLVFQHYALFPHMTADENIIAAMDHRPAGERRLRAGELLRLLHLEGLGSRKPQALSGGQQQRVAFARALARDPQVLLLDEPFSAVDRPTRNLLYREVAHLRGAIGAPIILVTHDFDEAARLADRMCLIDRGKVIQAGTPTEVLLHPVSARAARLVDHQNIFEAVVARHDGRRHRTVIIWQGRELEASHHPEFAAGNRVSWVIPSTHVILHRKEIAAEAPPNLLQGVIAEMATLSESMKVSVETEPGMRFSMTVPAHFTRRSALKVGSPVEIALQPEGLHLMTAD